MKDKTIKELQDDIKACDKLLRRHADDDNAYYAKGGLLVKFAKEAGCSLYYEEALQCYNKSIELSPQNPLYLVDRGKLYLQLNEKDLAIEDVGKAQELAGNSEGINALYIRDTIEAIQKKLGDKILLPEGALLLNQSSSELTTTQAGTRAEKANGNGNDNKNSDSITPAIANVTTHNTGNTITAIDNTNNSTAELSTVILSGECLEQDNHHMKHWYHKLHCELI